MSGIDQTVILGLAGKFEQVFGKHGSYLSYPAAPTGLKAASLRLLISDPLSNEGALAHAEFSTMVNEIPEGPVWAPDGDMLWNVYGDLLSSAVVDLIERPRTIEEQREYDDAFDLLYDDGPDGVPVPSTAVIAYEQYRDAYIAASVEYNNRKGEAELTDDVQVEEAWSRDESALRAAVDEAAANWAGAGRRGKVEAARETVSSFSSRSPAMVWEGYRRLFDPTAPEIFFRGTAEGQVYVPTGYLPSDLMEVDWPRITVTDKELPQLAERAPAELRSRLAGSGDSDIEEISFEYSYATVSRSWFSPDPINSRAWRFRDPSRVLSDGGSPPSGECTAYVIGLVLARNISVRRTKDAPKEAPDLGFIPITPTLPPRRPVVRDHRSGVGDPVVTRPRVRDHRTRRVTATDLQPRIAAWNPKLLAAAPAATATAAPTTDRVPTAAFTSVLSPAAVERMKLGSTFLSKRSVAITVNSRPAPQRPASATETTDPGEVFVLALHCKLLPKAPNPTQPAPEAPQDSDRTASDAAQPSGPRTYVVAKGDTLAAIAQRFYGDRGKWRRIHKANRAVIGDDPGLIRPGQKLVIP